FSHGAAIGQNLDVIRGELQRLIAVSQRRRKIAQPVMRDAAARPCLAQAPIQFDGPTEIGHRPVAVAHLIAHDGAVEIGLGVARVDFDDGAEIAYCSGEITLLVENNPAIEQGVEAPRVEFERNVVIATRAVEVAFAITGDATAVPSSGYLPLSGDGEIEIRDGAIELALFQPGVSAFDVRVGGIGA